MSDNSEQAPFIGDLMRVIHIDPYDQSVHVKYQNGRSARVNFSSDNIPDEGDLILVNEHGWEIAPEETWFASNSIAVVRKILDDGSAVIDDGITVKPIRNSNKVELSVNNTVEFNDIDGVLKVISNDPIRSREYGMDRKQLLREYFIDTTEDGPSFEDFGGYPEVVKRVRELIETQFSSRKYLDEIGARPLKGVLFSGPPGTGKTHLARIIAHVSKADFYLISGPSIVSKWVGDTEETLRKIFEAAIESKTGRAIIFFDEIDSIAERRTGESHEASKRLVAQLLTLMDGFEDKGKSVVVIAATNRVETLDPALMRSGRFDWEIEFGTPTFSDRLEILQVGANKLKTSEALPLTEIAELTEGWSAAELTSLWSEAALIAAGDARGIIAAEDIAQACERVTKRPKRLKREGGDEHV
jgi:transitional endoplasmic reticulum ATPase